MVVSVAGILNKMYKILKKMHDTDSATNVFNVKF